MKLKQMTCQNCGGTIELDFDHLISYCPYCGSKLMIDIANIDEVLKEREKTKCIFRKNRALAPHERSAVPLGTDHCPVG